MPDTGPDLIAAIIGKNTLMSLGDCPAVPIQIARAVYGVVQNDVGPGILITPGDGKQKQINSVIGCGGANSETEVWHFSVVEPLHHFVVVPWYRHESPHGQVYTVFMAWENRYTLQRYVEGTGGLAPALGGTGYKTAWTPSELSTMLSDLLAGGRAWQDYFGQVGAGSATLIKCWKYKTITLKSAISNVGRY